MEKYSMDRGSRGKPVYQLPTTQDHICKIRHEMECGGVILYICNAGLPLEACAWSIFPFSAIGGLRFVDEKSVYEYELQ